MPGLKHMQPYQANTAALILIAYVWRQGIGYR